MGTSRRALLTKFHTKCDEGRILPGGQAGNLLKVYYCWTALVRRIAPKSEYLLQDDICCE
jgi:hypothetical protein